MKWIITIAMLLAFLLTSSLAPAQTLRTATGKLIREGSTVYELLQHAGDPDRKVKLRDAVDVGKGKEQTTKVKYYYEKNSSLYIIIAEDDVIIRIDRKRM